MKILFEITSQGAADILIPLARACNRAGVSWECFFTGEGVLNLSREDVDEVLETAISAIACEASWESYMGEKPCPVKLGSQTNNSQIVGHTDRIISL